MPLTFAWWLHRGDRWPAGETGHAPGDGLQGDVSVRLVRPGLPVSRRTSRPVGPTSCWDTSCTPLGPVGGWNTEAHWVGGFSTVSQPRFAEVEKP